MSVQRRGLHEISVCYVCMIILLNMSYLEILFYANEENFFFSFLINTLDIMDRDSDLKS